jgi:hypothetical protein
MIHITGDTHGEHSIRRLKEVKVSGPNDVVIICGDFGLVFNNIQTPAEKHWLKWLQSKPFTTCFVRGNHENHELLDQLPTEQRWGNTVGVVCKNVYELKTGCIYNIDGRTVFAFGGAESTDRVWRTQGVNWWPSEVPTVATFNQAYDNLDAVNRKVDIIISHTAPASIVAQVFNVRAADPVALMLESFYSTVEFERYFCGHLHLDTKVDKVEILYTSIVQL